MLNIDKENLRDVYFTYKRYARLMCAGADSDEVHGAVDDAYEAENVCVDLLDLPWKIVETFQHMANEVAVLESSDPKKASELEDTYLTYLESL